MFFTAISLAALVPTLPPSDADPVRKLAMSYHHEDRRVFGAQLTIKVIAEPRAAETGGGYMLHVDYAIDYTGSRKLFIIFPPSFTEADGQSTRLFAYISDGKGGSRETGITSGESREKTRAFRKDGEEFLTSIRDQPVTGRLSVVYSDNQLSYLNNSYKMFNIQDFRRGEIVYFKLGYRPIERGGDRDAWVTAGSQDGAYPLKSNVFALRIGE